ncbi:hypothetical protein ACSNOK_07665 [Streptomyces sp. URMC 126]|uniref:hypothetical protein n=1 Tax=Streptomyces sp. URMC 126 TaxID=3423401 RepID=UPI003F1CDB5A
MENTLNTLWHRSPAAARAEADGLIVRGWNVHALAVIREHADEPRPSLHECVGLLDERAAFPRRTPAEGD